MLAKKFLPVMMGAVLIWQTVGIAQDYSSRYVNRSNASGQDVAQTHEGRFLVVGTSKEDVFLVQYDDKLKRVWSRTQHFTGGQVHRAMVTALDNECVVMVAVDDQVVQIIYDLQNGRQLRKGQIESLQGVAIQDVVRYDRRHILLGGNMQVEDNATDVVLMVVDLTGEIPQTRTYDALGSDEMLTQIQPTQDGGFVLVGNVIENDLADVLVQKVDRELNSVWTRRFEVRIPDSALVMKQLNAGQWITQARDGGYLVAGSAASFGNQIQAICMRLDRQGQLVWRTPFNGLQQSDLVGCFVGVDDGWRIMFAAEKRLPDEGGTRLCFAQLTPQGQQVQMVEQVKAGEDCDWVGAVGTFGQGFFYVKNSYSKRQDRLVVESEKVLDWESFFANERDRSERALRSLQWHEAMSNDVRPARQ